MAKGFKTGGRTRGTPNRATVSLGQEVERLIGKSVPAALVEVLQQTSKEDIKVKILMDLMPYLYPKRKSAEEVEEQAQEIDRLVVQFNYNLDDSGDTRFKDTERLKFEKEES
jgi:hypothetical protein